ncbi:TonB family protein [Nisaea sp.]|uniref:energy transducer TonB n=1 Tax=Nisaea sp. TaxID=2024842 RepID=UPI003B5253CA
MNATVERRGDISCKMTGFAVAVLLHGVVVWSMTMFQDPATSAFDTGSGGLTVMIGEAGGAQEIGAVAAAQAEGVLEGAAEEVALEQAPPVESVPVPEVTETVAQVAAEPPVETVTPEPVTAEPVEAVEPVAEPVEPEPVVTEAVDVPAIEAETVETVTALAPVPRPRPEPAPKFEMDAAPEQPRQAEPVKPAETEVAEADPVPDAKPADVRTFEQRRAGGAFSSEASSPTRSSVAGTLQAASGGGGAAGARNSYLASLQSWLERHKKYPRAARLRRYEGTVQFRFLIDRAGSVLERSIVASSGRGILDKAVLELLKRADPMPSMPPEIDGATLELTTSIDFRLR